MTISIAWVRQVGNTQELVFASDSRLTGGYHIDQCQKVFPLDREDCCISFAGHTYIAYPFILQIKNAINEYKKAHDRAVDVNDLKGIILKMLNRFVAAHEGITVDEFRKDLKETSFLFGGWSWRRSRFYVWRIHFLQGKNGTVREYVASDTGIWAAFGLARSNPVELGFVGDRRSDYVGRLLPKIQKKLSASRANDAPVHLDFEPLITLSEMLIDPAFVDRHSELKGVIGGSPQVSKIYPFARTLTYAVEWTEVDKKVYTLKGRVLADYEVVSVPCLNPFSGQTSRFAPTEVIEIVGDDGQITVHESTLSIKNEAIRPQAKRRRGLGVKKSVLQAGSDEGQP